MFYIIFFTIVGVFVGWLLWITRGAIAILLVIGLIYHFWNDANGTGGAELDKAYYCGVLGTDQTTAEWQNVFEWTQYDERFESTTQNYLWDFKSMSCVGAVAASQDGELAKIDETHDKLGYIYRYYYFDNGNVVSLYRDTKQFLWQRALMLRVDENCRLDRNSGMCVELPSAANCSWRDVYSMYDKCEYDTTGRGNMHDIQRKNLIHKEDW